MESLNYWGYFIQAIWFISTLIFVFSMYHIGMIKEDILDAFKKYEKGQRSFNFKNYGSALNPLIIFSAMSLIPSYEKNLEFYKIEDIDGKYKELKSSRKIALMGLGGGLFAFLLLRHMLG